jgi:hypothetical protein
VNRRDFSLVPFPTGLPVRQFNLEGEVDRRYNSLRIQYAVTGALDELLIPAPASIPQRRNRLWEGTCLECFLAISGSPRYWECNVSPSGDWNVFRFTAYRQDGEEETRITSLPVTVVRRPSSLAVAWTLNLVDLVDASTALVLGLSAVLLHDRRGRSYWAQNHGGRAPDFHRRDGFVVSF